MQISSELRSERLRRLRQIAEAAPDDERFDMRTWTREGQPCGTAHCLGGWAGVDPEFAEQGFLLNRVYGLVLCDQKGTPCAYGFTACALFFGLNESETNLFEPVIYSSTVGEQVKAEVIANIDALLAGQPIKSFNPCLLHDQYTEWFT
jgi:hypothetical protein